jgi:hypothetical protein
MTDVIAEEAIRLPAQRPAAGSPFLRSQLETIVAAYLAYGLAIREGW